MQPYNHMISVDLSQTSCELIELKKSLLGKLTLEKAARLDFSQGENWQEKLTPFIRGKEIAFTIPDTHVFSVRFKIQTSPGENLVSAVTTQVQENIPVSLKDLLYDFSPVGESYTKDLKLQDILFIATSSQTFLSYWNMWQALGAKPSLAVPESLAAFEILKGQITEKGITLYIDVGAKTSNVVFFDSLGPLLTFSEAVETQTLEKEVKEKVSFFTERYRRKVTGVLLGGGGSLTVDLVQFQKAVGIATGKIDQYFNNKLSQLELKLPVADTPPTLFFTSFGLALLSCQGSKLNLAKPANISQILKKP